MGARVRDRLQAGYEDYTVAERMIAGWLIDNLDRVPFETAASVGARVGVSAMTVGRFLKARGWNGLTALKEELRGDRDAPWLLARPQSPDARLQAELAAIADVYALASTPGWSDVVRLLANAGTVHVAGFQTERGLAAAFADHLSHVRGGVRSHESGAGRFPALLSEAGPEDALVLVDIRRYSRHFRVLGERAVTAGIPLIVVTDPYCPWARDLTPHILAAEVSLGHFWDMNTALASLLNLLVDDVVRAIGAERVHERLARVSGHYAEFIGFQPGGTGGN
ncbi:RpiR family transcriptional regulator [Polymorphobacter multimanifer]|uniref:DNA-binding MurR/RpiR family transcriptional regulator n=1 Tax=Polymorphobacter multimanifer TaxID=1070431 RepID=A0A841L7D5_9SPHN|nr:MurR/RpiR family transcriptional regulator [Polymorphobacter multimanifer]MBB6227491.1 DNA-binding MurR/RpiR family transcriptional regulator [Polymorphobacter multimanifer]GGI68396.1 RpiR family transcriptional regulator [Polymorphobacter multimanifer]